MNIYSHKEKTQETAQEETSGYVKRLDDEMNRGNDMPLQHTFISLQEFYVSPNGHTRLFHASRYGKNYVLKCLKKDYLYVPLYRQALNKEFEIGLQLDHPCISHTIGLENVPRLGPAIIMERIDGCTLKSLMEQGSITKMQARKWVIQTADAVDYLHSKQIVHRDLKPSNIMVTHNGQNVKLIDFSLSDSDTFNVLKLPAGTSGYIAPEQLLPDAKADVRADIYSLGIIMRDMSKITDDKLMSRIAKACTRRNINERPANIYRLKQMAKREHMQTHTLAILIFLSALSGVCLAMVLHHKLVQAQENSNVPSDGNQAKTYELWPRLQPTPLPE